MNLKFNKKNKLNYLKISLIIMLTILCIFVNECTKKNNIYRVGILIDGNGFNDMIQGFKDKMTELGYIENESISYFLEVGEGDTLKNKYLAENLVKNKVDLILSLATPSTMAAYAVTKGTDIPLVFAYIDTENTKIIKSVREPGGNITGVRYPGPELEARRLEILKEIAPNVKCVWIGYDTRNPANESSLKAVRKTAINLGITLVEVPAVSFDDLKKDLSKRNSLNDPGIDAIILMPDGLNHMPNGLKLLTEFSYKHKIPLGGSFLYTVEKGAIFGYANDIYKVGELAAPIADKILKGTPAGTIPVVTPNQDLIINYKLIKEMGLTVPEGLLNQAQKIIR